MEAADEQGLPGQGGRRHHRGGAGGHGGPGPDRGRPGRARERPDPQRHRVQRPGGLGDPHPPGGPDRRRGGEHHGGDRLPLCRDGLLPHPHLPRDHRQHRGRHPREGLLRRPLPGGDHGQQHQIPGVLHHGQHQGVRAAAHPPEKQGPHGRGGGRVRRDPGHRHPGGHSGGAGG